MSKILPIRRSKQQARQFYNRISRIYDWITSSEQSFIQEGVSLLSPSPGELMLEIGSGTGSALVLISKALSNQGSVIGLDLSQKMLLTSQKKTRGMYLSPDHIQGDGIRLPFKNDQFDALFCSFTLELFSIDDLQHVLREIQRVLKPSGRMVIIALAQTPRTLAVRLYEVAHRLFPVMIDCRPIPLLAQLRENGFQIITSIKKTNFGIPVWITLAQH